MASGLSLLTVDEPADSGSGSEVSRSVYAISYSSGFGLSKDGGTTPRCGTAKSCFRPPPASPRSARSGAASPWSRPQTAPCPSLGSEPCSPVSPRSAWRTGLESAGIDPQSPRMHQKTRAQYGILERRQRAMRAAVVRTLNLA